MIIEKDEFQKQVASHLAEQDFYRIALTGKKNKNNLTIPKRIELRPVEIRSQIALQANNIFDRNSQVENHFGEVPFLLGKIMDYLALGYEHLLIFTAEWEIDYKFTKDEKIVLTRVKAKTPVEIDLAHDQKKIRALDPKSKYLQALGVTDANGSVKRNMADKYRQIEEFVNLISPALKRLNKNGTLEIVDCGSGSSYLTFAIAAYCLEQNIDFHITGIETRADLTDKSEKLAKNLNLESKMSFAQKTIAQFAAERELTAGSKLDLVVALHACDTATDEAIALGIGLGAKEIMVAPCCQHTLQKELANNSSLAALGMFRSPGIIRERFLDLVTDQLRINVLRQFGYKADVVEFIPSEHTARNLLLRASRKSENLSSAATNSVGDDKADELFNDSMTPIKFEPPLLRIISEYFPNLKR